MEPLKSIVTTIAFLSVIGTVYAQNNGEITGSVKDAQTLENIASATVALTDQHTKVIIKGTQTNLNGSFVLDKLPVGTFTLQLSFVGYDRIVKENVVIDSPNDVLSLGDIQMNASKEKVLNEVTITAKKPTIQNKDGKKVFSVNQSLVSQGGTAADLLQNVPTLQIDVNGNVSLRGSTGVKVLIDGKPSLIAGGDVTQILQAIPAGSIESVEVIANPSAKYDAEGQGIINIVLKKNSKVGFNGSVALAGGTRSNYNGSAALSYQTNKINLYGNYSLRDGDTYSNGFQYLTFLKPTDAIVFSNETFPSTTRNKVQNLKIGIDYSVAPKSILSVSGSLNLRNTHRDELLDIDNLDASGLPVQYSTRNNTTHNNGNSYELDLDYSQHFKKPKEELTFNFTYSHGTSRNLQVYQTIYSPRVDNLKTGIANSEPDPLESDIWNNGNNYNIQADYILPTGKTGQIAAGYRSQISLGNNNQYAYDLSGTNANPIYSFTNLFSSNKQVHAVYLNYYNQIGNFRYELGLRGEDSHLNATFQGYDTNNSLYSTLIKVPDKGLYPSIFLTQKLNNDQQLQLSYTNRVTRPTPRELNPSTDFSDPTNYETGNPHLIPESINSLELGYNKNWQNISFTSSIYYNRLNNVIKHIESDPVNGVITTTAQNLKHSTTTGLELIGHFDLIKAWDFTANANVFERRNDAAPEYGIAANSGLSWNANITNNILLVKKLSVQIRADYRAADFVIQDRNRAAFGMDAGAKYDFAGNNASLSFNSIDIFNSRKWAFLRSSDGLLLDFERRTVGSRATLTFTYRFGKSTGVHKQPKKKEENPDRRIDDAS
ncbi:outer membrane beta-barrel family protein [Mucilaginibacter sp. SP1R1]|uniref:outer membrane beta-barrel family protein n=1 Tax=Mucilaginibacter sp. SP1R1 TaxID=2723091 RepID=UPI001617DFB9|nr:outer membrane beta-barrel family protein [Mucilaginibacter sp. SP1R1]MBB6148153.1 outer membrane receptor protein involved in Fe transport [Mucilaginibacter sp. SP1R1]